MGTMGTFNHQILRFQQNKPLKAILARFDRGNQADFWPHEWQLIAMATTRANCFQHVGITTMEGRKLAH